jgi:hypothetical protein
LLLSIPLVNAAATRAGLAGIARIDKHHGHAGPLRLVRDEVAQLVESPGMQARTLTAPGRNPPAYALKIFQNKAARGAFGSLHDHLRNAVVRIFTEPGLLPGQLAETTFGGFSAAPLQAALTTEEVDADSLDSGPGVDFAIAVGCERNDTEIHTKPVRCLELVCFRNIASRSQHPLAADEAKVDLALAIGHQSPLMLADHKGHSQAPFDRPQTDASPVLGEPDNAVIIGLGGIFSERWRDVSTDLKGIRHFGDAADRSLSGERETGSQIYIGQLVQIVLPECISLKSSRRQPRAGLITTCQCCPQSRRLGFRRLQLRGGNKLHIIKYRARCEEKQGLSRNARPATPLSASADSLSRRLR